MAIGGSWPAIQTFVDGGNSMNAPARNVLMVTRELSGDRRYGLGRSLMPVVQALQERGWRVRYLCQEDLPESAKAGRSRWLARIVRIPGLAGSGGRQVLLGAMAERLQMGWFAARTAEREGFTSAHLHDPWLACGFWLGLKFLRSRGVRWGVAEHGFGCYSRATHDDGLTQGPRAQRWLRRLEAFVLNAADWVTAPTQSSLDQLARDLALPCNPSHWLAIAHAALPIALPGREQARGELGWSDNDFYLLGIGRLAPLKRFDLMVGAWASLAHRHPRLHLQILGGGDSQGYRRAAEATGLGERIHFAVVDDVKPYLAAADVYLSTSATESFGLANLEALLAALPCICTAVGGVPEVMGRGAWLIPVEQQALQDALGELIDEPSQRKAWSMRAAAQAGKALGVEPVTDRYVELFTR